MKLSGIVQKVDRAGSHRACRCWTMSYWTGKCRLGNGDIPRDARKVKRMVFVRPGTDRRANADPKVLTGRPTGSSK